jgi:hypothetical protein
MVVWIDTQQKEVSCHKEKGCDIKTYTFEDKSVFDRFPKYGEFTLVVAKYDFFSPIKLGYDRYKKCTVVHFDENNGNISVKVNSDGFYNQSQIAELRADKIESLIF